MRLEIFRQSTPLVVAASLCWVLGASAPDIDVMPQHRRWVPWEGDTLAHIYMEVTAP
jgi:hypothetical protein